ncbi:MAG: UpxY family transcription antiterminator [Candidatus Kapaibacterium sp.]
MDKKWYVLQTKPLQEKKVFEQINKKNIEVYLPFVETIRYWSDRKKKVKVPLFPGYLFVHADKNKRYEAISSTIGALRYLVYQKRFAVVKEEEINNIRISLIEPERVKIENVNLYEGDKVEITRGIFKGLKGAIVQFRGNYKLMVNIIEMNTTFSVELSNSEVKLIN